ncbi:hypothetical protein Glove_23g208 [Diversispora epigaea]|uniref:Reverse transcriptase domain-containing protein n=1 Tax=Diversispora epigaea TaxID=1348612 RepID=A0A397JJ17_9GLOM|nr:hypothetical protein Glove_23g208 [Diversispora epigaea]
MIPSILGEKKPLEDNLDIDIDDLFEITSVEVFSELTNNLTNNSSSEFPEITNQDDNFSQDTSTFSAKNLSLNSLETLELTEKTSKKLSPQKPDCWKIITQNINGLNNIKFDVILLTETRLKEKGVKFTFLEQKLTAKEENKSFYECFWASNKNGAREQGVGFIIQHELAKHIYKIDKFQDRAIFLYFSFREKITVCMIGIYKYANKMDRIKKGKNLTKWIEKQIEEAQKKNYISIIMDRINSTLRKTETRLLEMLKYKGYQDCYRLLHDKVREFTFFRKNIYQHRKPVSCIDQIWVPLNQADNPINAEIIDTEFTAYSDHNAMAIDINNREFIKNTQYNKNRKDNQKKRLWNLKGTTKYLVDTQWSIKIGIISKGKKFLTKTKEPKNQISLNWHKHPMYSTLNLLRKLCKLRTRDNQLAWYDNIKILFKNTRKFQLRDYSKQMINSMFKTGPRKIVLDRIVKILTDGKKNIITDLEGVKKEVQIHLRDWTINGKTLSESISDFWLAHYLPQELIDGNIYNETMQPITQDELTEHIKLCSNNKVPGPSLILYEVFKHLGPHTINWITNFFNDILVTGQTPREWSQTKTLIENKVLNHDNYAGLPRDRMAFPIYVTNNIMEDAREKGNEMWILFQDIKKAFDTVDLDIIQCMLTNRINQGITEFGKTEKYEVQKGIDQGDSISPLLWCIFYDPLLTAIGSLGLEYHMSIQFYTNINTGQQSKWEVQIPSLAYMDDTEKEKELIVNQGINFGELTIKPKRQNEATNGKQIRYLINQVIFSQIEYLITDMILPDTLIASMNNLIRKAFKQKCDLAKTFLNMRMTAGKQLGLGYNTCKLRCGRQKKFGHNIQLQDSIKGNVPIVPVGGDYSI